MTTRGEKEVEVERTPVSGYVHQASYEHRVFERKRLRQAVIVTGSVMVLEVVGGLISNRLPRRGMMEFRNPLIFSLMAGFATITGTLRSWSLGRWF